MYFWMHFLILDENAPKMGPEMTQTFSQKHPLNAPKTFPERIWHQTSTFHRFCIDFGSHFGRILMVLGTFFGIIFAGSPFPPIPKYLIH